jgi:hypothetical protein
MNKSLLIMPLLAIASCSQGKETEAPPQELKGVSMNIIPRRDGLSVYVENNTVDTIKISRLFRLAGRGHELNFTIDGVARSFPDVGGELPVIVDPATVPIYLEPKSFYGVSFSQRELIQLYDLNSGCHRISATYKADEDTYYRKQIASQAIDFCIE